MDLHQKFMKRAIELSAQASLINKSGGPFGAVIVKDGQIIAEGMNRVLETNDPTCHAEMDAIRQASMHALKNYKLDGCILYTSAEPCPMCLSACYWSHIEIIYYAAKVDDALHYGSFDDSFIYEEFKKSKDEREITCIELLRSEALDVWEKYVKMDDRIHY